MVGLKAALNDGQAAVRRCAARLVPYYGASDVAAILEEIARDERHPDVASTAREALAALRAKLGAIGA